MNPECFRELLGDDLVFMNLSMGKEDKMKRLLARHGGDEQTASMFDVSFSFILVLLVFFKKYFQDYEKVMAAGGDEGDMVKVLVTAEMSREQVVEQIIKTETEIK